MTQLRSYAALAFLVMAGSAFFYVSHLRETVATQAARIADLEVTEKNLRAAQKVLEDTADRRIKSVEAVETIKREVTVETDAPNPAPIERALDGLRKLQAKPRSP